MWAWHRVVALGVVIAGCGLLLEACSSHRREVTAGWPAFGSSCAADDPWCSDSALEMDTEPSAAVGSGGEAEEAKDSFSAGETAAGLVMALLAVALAVGQLAFPFLL